MSKRKVARMISGGLRDIAYGDDEEIRDNESSLAFKKELDDWQSNPRKYWLEHGGKDKIIKYSIVSLIVISIVALWVLFQ